MGLSPARPGRAGSLGSLARAASRPGAAQREDSGTLCPRCPPATSRLSPPHQTRLEGQRGKKGKIKIKKGPAGRKRRVRQEGTQRSGVPASSSARLGGSSRRWKMSRGGKGRKSVEEKL